MSQNIKNTSSSRKKIKECHSAEADALLECARSEGRHEPSSIDSAGDQSTQLCLNHFLTGHNWAKSKLQEFASTNKANCAIARYVNLACYEVKTLMELVEADGDSPSGQLNPLGNVAQFISAIYPKYGYSSLRVLRIEAKRKVANVPLAALLDEKIQILFEAWQDVIHSCRAGNRDKTLESKKLKFLYFVDELRDYVELDESEENPASTSSMGRDPGEIQRRNPVNEVPKDACDLRLQSKPRKSRGRPTHNKQKFDKQVSEMWGTGCYRIYRDIACMLSSDSNPVSEEDVRMSLDRTRKRRIK